MACEIVAITNQKGGVGKSTTSYALATGLLKKNKKVLVVDLDSQGSTSLTANTDTSQPTSYELLTKQCNAQEVVQTNNELVDIIAASKKLSLMDVELSSTLGKEYRLKESLKDLRNNYDFIIIDTPPALGLITLNALTCADSLIIPAQAEIYSLQGIGQLYNTIEAVKEYTNPTLVIKGILLTRYNNRSVISRDMAENAQAIATQLNTFVYKSAIREAVAIKEAQATRQSIFTYAPKSKVTNDYLSFINEFMDRSGYDEEKL